MGQSWFYLTLWRGTPPEFTDEAEVEIVTASFPAASVETTSNAETEIKTSNSHEAEIVGSTLAAFDIITTTEVVWIVGRTVH